MTARMHRSLGGGLPGHYAIGQAPAPIWPDAMTTSAVDFVRIPTVFDQRRWQA